MDDSRNDLDAVRALDARHVVQVYKRAPVVFERGAGVYLFDDAGTALSRPDLRRRRGVARSRESGAGRGPRRPGADARPHLEPLLPPTAGTGGVAPRVPLGPPAHVLLQQRHRGDRRLPEVRAALLAHALATRRARGSWPSSTRSTDGRWGRCRSRGTITIARRSRRCWRMSRGSRPTTRRPSRRRSRNAPRRSWSRPSRARAACAR